MFHLCNANVTVYIDHCFKKRINMTTSSHKKSLVFKQKGLLVLLGAEQFVDSFWEAHGTVFGGVLVLLQGRRAPVSLQDGAFGVRGPRDGGVGQGLAQSAVPEQGVVENPVHPVPQGCDWGVLPVVQAGHG